MSLHMLKRLTRIFTRSVATTILLPAVPLVNSPTSSTARLRVPLLKSPLHLGHFLSRLTRRTNEDAYSASVVELAPRRQIFAFGVYDGHGGPECSEYLSRGLAADIERSNGLCVHPRERKQLAREYADSIGGYWKRWAKHLDHEFAEMEARSNDMYLTNYDRSYDDMHLRLPLTFLQTDYNFCQGEEHALGSTCTLAFFETLRPVNHQLEASVRPEELYYFNRGTVSVLTIAHVGDSRAILVDRLGTAHALTEDHHPLNQVESHRLQRYAANYFMTDSFGEERFVALANTRAFGDANYKHMGVTAEPQVDQLVVGCYDTIQRTLTPTEIDKYTIGGLGGDEAFLVLCLDGITNFVTDQEIADIIMSYCNNHPHTKATPHKCAAEVVHFVEYIGGNDNATCLVVRLTGWGKWPIQDRTGELRQSRMDAYRPSRRGE